MSRLPVFATPGSFAETLNQRDPSADASALRRFAHQLSCWTKLQPCLLPGARTSRAGRRHHLHAPTPPRIGRYPAFPGLQSKQKRISKPFRHPMSPKRPAIFVVLWAVTQQVSLLSTAPWSDPRLHPYCTTCPQLVCSNPCRQSTVCIQQE